jgi:cytochrome oxidase Cu insertion factor (SCO1/SenC/PrrC family)
MTKRTLSITVIAALLGGGVIGVVIALTHGHAHRAPTAQTNGSAASASPRGFSAAALEAQYVWPEASVLLLTFLDSRCKQACPIEGCALASIQRSLHGAMRPKLVAVSVNPARDTIASTRAAARKWRFAQPWLWHRGNQRTLARVWRSYQIDVQPQAADIAHSTAVYLVDRRGFERALYLFPFSAQGVTRAVRMLAKS